MRCLFQFSEERFKSLPIRTQHKKCAELLKELYLHSNRQDLHLTYTLWCRWMSYTPLPILSKEALSDRYHEHLSHTRLSDVLPQVQTGDRTTALPWLGITTFLDRLRSLHNIGSIMRTIEAFRLGPLVLSNESHSFSLDNLKKSSMGSESEVPLSVSRFEDLPRPWIAVETVESACSYSSFIYPDSLSLIVGNEESGIRKEYLTKVDFCVTIPLRGKKNSLNVSNAFAIVAAEIASQRSS